MIVPIPPRANVRSQLLPVRKPAPCLRDLRSLTDHAVAVAGLCFPLREAHRGDPLAAG